MRHNLIMKIELSSFNFHGKNMSLIHRKAFLRQIEEAFKVNPVVALLGPRQCGKTTLANRFAKQVKQSIHHFDLEDPDDLARLEAPKLAFENLKGLIIIDEIQRRPELFPLLRVLVDQDRKRKFLILG